MSKKTKCKACGKAKPFKRRYIITEGEMGTQEVLDQVTGQTFWGDDCSIISQLIDELNRLHNEQTNV